MKQTPSRRMLAGFCAAAALAGGLAPGSMTRTCGRTRILPNTGRTGGRATPMR